MTFQIVIAVLGTTKDADERVLLVVEQTPILNVEYLDQQDIGDVVRGRPRTIELETAWAYTRPSRQTCDGDKSDTSDAGRSVSLNSPAGCTYGGCRSTKPVSSLPVLRSCTDQLQRSAMHPVL